MGFFSKAAEKIGDLMFTGLGGKASAKMNYDNQLRMYKEGPKAQVEGYKAAGINPIAAAGQIGSGTVQAGTTTSGGISNLANSASNAYNTIKSMINQDQQTENQTNLTAAQIENLGTQSAKNIEETKTIPQYLKNDNARTQAEVANKNKQNQLINEEIVSKQIQNAIDEVEKLVETGNFGKVRKYVDKTMQSLQGVAGVAGSLILGPLAAFKGVKSAKEAQNLIKTYRASKAAHSSSRHRSYK